jgi:hypothetical protein
MPKSSHVHNKGMRIFYNKTVPMKFMSDSRTWNNGRGSERGMVVDTPNPVTAKLCGACFGTNATCSICLGRGMVTHQQHWLYDMHQQIMCNCPKIRTPVTILIKAQQSPFKIDTLLCMDCSKVVQLIERESM